MVLVMNGDSLKIEISELPFGLTQETKNVTTKSLTILLENKSDIEFKLGDKWSSLKMKMLNWPLYI